jgi:hypothetical protein
MLNIPTKKRLFDLTMIENSNNFAVASEKGVVDVYSIEMTEKNASRKKENPSECYHLKRIESDSSEENVIAIKNLILDQ